MSRKQFDDIFSHLDTIHECDGRTDGRRLVARTYAQHRAVYKLKSFIVVKVRGQGGSAPLLRFEPLL